MRTRSAALVGGTIALAVGAASCTTAGPSPEQTADAIYAGGVDIGAPVAEYGQTAEGDRRYVQRALAMLEGLHGAVFDFALQREVNNELGVK